MMSNIAKRIDILTTSFQNYFQIYIQQNFESFSIIVFPIDWKKQL